jgi:sigma-B regulation protein RsbU (phosphoserine phosphatase)
LSNATIALRNLPDDVRLLRLEALVAASESLNRACGLDDILRVILNLVSMQLECERATVFLRDQRTDKLHARQMIGSEDHIEIVLERGVGIAGYVAETGESVLINDVQADPRFDSSTDVRTGFVTRTMLCVPLKKPEGTLLGSLQAINARAGQFTDADLAYLESFAALAAVAVEREQLAQEAVRSQMLSTELNLARKIQQRLLPPSGIITLPQPLTAWGTSQPCFDVGGDAYDVVMLPTGECAFWVADVSGKGIGAALLMSTLQTELRAFVRAESDLARLATELNARVTDVAPLGTYATLFLGVLDTATGGLRFVNAGHLPPVWMNRQLPDERKFEATGMPIGLLPGSVYETGAVVFARGERLAIFSDGVTEAENIAGIQYEEDGLADSFTRIKTYEVEQIGQEFFNALDCFRIGAPAKDDTTFLVIGLG